MDYASIKTCDKGIILENVINFEPKHTFECGQCFRWNKTERGSYIGVAFNKVIEVEKNQDNVVIYNTNMQEFNDVWEQYFDFKRDYTKLKNDISTDEIMKVSVEFGSGMRILRQDPFELIVSFIISANNMIPRIKKSIENICKRWGKSILYEEKEYYSFPTPEELSMASVEELEECGIGFRAKYIHDTVEKLLEEKKDINSLYRLENIIKLDDDDCHKALQTFSGIGPKVADCIMLFSMGKYSAFPVDVWVKRAMHKFYLAPDVSLKKIRDFGRDKFGKLSGFAQQYLFYYARENHINVDE